VSGTSPFVRGERPRQHRDPKIGEDGPRNGSVASPACAVRAGKTVPIPVSSSTDNSTISIPSGSEPCRVVAGKTATVAPRGGGERLKR